MSRAKTEPAAAYTRSSARIAAARFKLQNFPTSARKLAPFDVCGMSPD